MDIVKKQNKTGFSYFRQSTAMLNVKGYVCWWLEDFVTAFPCASFLTAVPNIKCRLTL